MPIRLRIFVCAGVSLLVAVACVADPPLSASFRAAAQAFDLPALAAIQGELDRVAESNTTDFNAQLAAAECYARRASIHRNARHIQALPKAEDKSRRAEQEAWGAAGLVFAERAIALAATDLERAQAHRVAGELYSHLITGMISGMRNGPKAKRHVEAALKLAPKDPECNRAIGIMYLHNPPISGGDLDKAVETFQACAAADPKNDRYLVLLAMSYRKRGEEHLARDAVRNALRLNPKNQDAQHLGEALR